MAAQNGAHQGLHATGKYLFANQERLCAEVKNDEEQTPVGDLRGVPVAIGTLEEITDDDHSIVITASGPEYYAPICRQGVARTWLHNSAAP